MRRHARVHGAEPPRGGESSGEDELIEEDDWSSSWALIAFISISTMSQGGYQIVFPPHCSLSPSCFSLCLFVFCSIPFLNFEIFHILRGLLGLLNLTYSIKVSGFLFFFVVCCLFLDDLGKVVVLLYVLSAVFINDPGCRCLCMWWCSCCTFLSPMHV